MINIIKKILYRIITVMSLHAHRGMNSLHMVINQNYIAFTYFTIYI